jgi:hypothetical protein
MMGRRPSRWDPLGEEFIEEGGTQTEKENGTSTEK